MTVARMTRNKRLLWVLAALASTAAVVGSYMYLHQPKPPKPASIFTGHFTAADVAKLEQQAGKSEWVQGNGTIDPLKITDGTQYTLTATTDAAYRPYIGKSFMLQIVVPTRNGGRYPILFAMQPEQKGVKYLLGVNALSAIGWREYFQAKDGLSKYAVVNAANQSGQYTFLCQSGLESGKTLVVANFERWNDILGQSIKGGNEFSDRSRTLTN